jgi:hypothetical protein
MKFCYASLAASFWLLAAHARADSTVVFNEIMYHPNATNEAQLEWLELHNQMAVDMDLSGWSLAGGVQFTFPEGTVLGGGQYLVVASSPATLIAATGAPNVLGPFTGRLSNNGDELELRNNSQRLMDAVNYGVEGDWPVGADGAGVSLAKRNADAGSAAPESWTISARVGGTPGSANFPGTRPVTSTTSLLPVNASWRYEQSGADLGATWTQINFDDGAWENGQGLLAVETCGCLPEPIRTTLTLGRTNYYFRTRFDYPGDPTTATLRLRHVIDDGAVVYLNGAEVWRIGMPAGPIAHTTFAARSIDNAGYEGPFPIPSGALVRGINVLAVEVHQNSGASSDITFGLELTESHTDGASGMAAPAATPLAFNELESATNANFWVELVNAGKTNASLEGCRIARLGGAYREFTFSGGSLAPGELLSVSRATLGFSADPGDKLVLYGPGQSNVLDAVVAKRAARARVPDGTGAWLVPTQRTPGASNVVTLRNEVVINELMYEHRPLPAAPGVYAPTNLVVSITNGWRYNQQGSELGTAWRQTNYNDDAWPSGRALLYVTTATLPAPKNTALSLTNDSGTRLITWYFRTPFVFAGDVASAELLLRTIVDDGAVFYLNGVEVHRQNMPAGTISYANLANVSVATPGFSGPFSIPKTSLVSGMNWLAAEVHQFTTNALGADVVFGAELSATSLIAPAQPKRESPESWLELFNRGTTAVNLTGWKLSGGIDFDFATNQTIPSGGYLVIAKDPAYLQSLYPGLNVLGPFEKSLSRKSDRVLLEDPLGNPADAVRYYGEGRWPRFANGGGSSLELRDPRADNSQAEAWAASNESGKSSWATYSYRGIATAEPAPSPDTWKEFVLGLLEAGEVLLDDIKVIDSPNGAATQLLQNGNFENGLGAWRILGNHKGSVITDPDNAGNHVLRLVATGSTEHMHNHAETTLAGGAAIVNGREYEISFRAKWVGGNNAVLTRLYFNRLARVTSLPVPSLNGTPGAVNSRYATNIGPTYTGFRHMPAVPAANEPVPVFVQAADPDGVANLTLHWSANGGAWNQVPMAAQLTGGYLGTVPGQGAATLVQFFVEGTDARGARSTYPDRGTNSRALFRVNDGQAVFDALHNIRILMPTADSERLHAPTNVMSNDPVGATVIYNEQQVFYNVSLHLRGSGRGRAESFRVGFTIRFDPDDLFRGVQDSLSLDRQGWFNAAVGGNHDEILYKHMINHAGGLPGMYDDLVHVLAPRPQESSTALMLMANYGDEFLDSQYVNGGDGDLFKLELIYYPTTTADGTPQGLKVPYPQPDGVLGVDFQNLGSNQEAYRWNFLKENNQADDRWDQMMELAKMFSLTGTNIDAPSQKLLDVNEWCRAFAIESLFGNSDTYGFGLPHNFMLYFRPADGRALAFPWDMDVSFYLPTSSPLLPNANVTKVFTLPANQRLFYSHLYDLVTTTYNPTYMGRWTAHYAGLLGQNWSGALNYIGNRRNYVLGQLPTALAFAITSNGGNEFTINNNLVTLTGTAPIQVEYIAVNGTRYAVRWTSTTTWSLTVPVGAGTNTLALQAFDRYGRLLTNVADTIKVVNNSAVPSPLGFVVINEIHYHAATEGGGFVELHNTHPDVAFDLSNWRLDGADFTFAEGSVIPPGGFFVVAGDTNAFTFIYTNASRPGGQYAGHLQNNGELLKLVRAVTTNLDEIIDAVRYGDRAPWPTNADGYGASLQLIDPALERTRVANWAAAAPTPGATNSVRASLTPFPPLWLNELLVFNTNGPVDNFGEREPWIELCNRGNNSVSLNGLFLTDNLSNLTRWAFPPGGSLAPDEFRVIQADGQPGQTATTNFHTSFRLTNSAGVVALVRSNAGRTEVLDYMEYAGLTPNRAFGSWPDGQPIDRQIFFYATPGAPNNRASAPVPVVINEFMADNAGPGGLRDPSDGLFQDWFELYNPNPTPFDLSGYFLTDTLAQPMKWQIPLNTFIAGHGFLLVWADNEPAQTALSPLGDLHANFQLSAGGEAIALFAPDGALQHQVVFGAQLQNTSQGLLPDGNTNAWHFMPNWTPRASNQAGTPPPSQVVSVMLEPDGNLSFTFSAIPGRTYQVEYKGDLAAPTWIPLGPNRTAATPTITVTDFLDDSPQRFYRTVLLP